MEFHVAGARAEDESTPTKISRHMVHGEVAGLKNGEPVMAGVLEGDHRDKMADRLLKCGGGLGCLGATQVYRQCHHSIERIRLAIRLQKKLYVYLGWPRYTAVKKYYRKVQPVE